MQSAVIEDTILDFFKFAPTAGQAELIRRLSEFLSTGNCTDILLLNGFAGTGKTTVVGAVVKAMGYLGVPVLLAAPTGRAAKVLGSYSSHTAYTLHKLIYRQKEQSVDSHFELGFNRMKNALFIVDECSMLSNSGDSTFGSGCLMDDMLQYIFGGIGECKLLMLGDTAQLPPVMQDESPALNAEYLRGYGFDVEDYMLTEVVRQSDMSGILSNATMLRKALAKEADVRFVTAPDVIRVDGTNFTEMLESSYRQVGEDETLIVTRSNQRAYMYAEGIRTRILFREELISNGDVLMIVKNNYALPELPEECDFTFIANGDLARVERQRKVIEMYGMQFAEVTLDFVDYGCSLDMLLLRDALMCKTPAELSELQERLYNAVAEDYAHIKSKKKRYEAMRKDKFLNALVARSAYAVTCHKAQGGGWSHVYVDMGRVSKEELDAGYLRWLYTAVTRAKDKLFLINFPDEMF